jgi:FkbM family methyltransferase
MSLIRTAASATYGMTLRALYSRQGLPWTVHDETVRIDPRVRHLVPHEPEPGLFQFLRTTVRPGDVVLDVGAFLGIYATLEARWSGPSGRVIAFEPTPSSVAVARHHLEWNAVADRVALIEAAVSDRPSRATFHQYDAGAMPYVNSLVAAVDTDTPAVMQEVAVVTIDDICRERGLVPSVIRMDVQGAEIHALRGARETLARADRLTMVVEMHPQCWDGFGITESDARDTIRGLGLHVRPLVQGEELFARDTHAVLTKAAGNRGSNL